jgi:hypothetical protein
MSSTQILTTLSKILPAVRNILQYGIAILGFLVFLILKIDKQLQVLPVTLLLSLVPLFFLLQFRPRAIKLQLIQLLFIGLASFALIGAAVITHTADIGAEHARGEMLRRSSDENLRTQLSALAPTQTDFERSLLYPLVTETKSSVQYPEYRERELVRWHNLNNTEKSRFIELTKSMEFTTACVRDSSCPSQGYRELAEKHDLDFWYSFRPIIEELRLDIQGQDFGAIIQKIAEARTPPHWRSAVVRDANTGKTQLASSNPTGS